MNHLDDVVARLEQQRSAIDRALSALHQLGGSDGSGLVAPPQTEPAITPKGGITPAGRRKLAEALRRRWAEKRAAQAQQEQAEKYAQAAQKRRATLARKRMSEAMKRRWATKRAAAASQQWAAAKTAESKKSIGTKNKAAGKKAIVKEETAPVQE